MNMIRVVAGAAALGGVGIAAYGIRGRSAQMFGPSVYRGAGKRRSVAITFDDGPSEGSLRLLEYLDQRGVPATFFQCGQNVLRNPQIARIIQAHGHEIGNHTYSHPRLCPSLTGRPRLKSPDFIYTELSRTQEIIEGEVGVVATLFRAPYGLRWYGLGSAQRWLHLLGVMWTVIGHDWEWPGHRVAELVLRRATPGGIICLHDGRDIQPRPDVSEMITAVRRIVPILQDQGFKFETVSQLLRPDPATV
jgi:peptidoglycan/xylan/chitin deacetylase (PgdA/CDA1 family)